MCTTSKHAMLYALIKLDACVVCLLRYICTAVEHNMTLLHHPFCQCIRAIFARRQRAACRTHAPCTFVVIRFALVHHMLTCSTCEFDHPLLCELSEFGLVAEQEGQGVQIPDRQAQEDI